MNENHKEAKEILEMLIQNQSHLFEPMPLSTEQGEKLADFCAAFIRKYQEHLKKAEQTSLGKLE